MKTLSFTTAFLVVSPALFAQGEPHTLAFQTFSSGGNVSSTITQPVTRTINGDMMGGAVTGRPFSATEERHTVQTLGDGTRIESKDEDRIYRDSQGRTRIERENGKLVTINDPVAGTFKTINTVSKTVFGSGMRMLSQTSGNNVRIVEVQRGVKLAGDGNAVYAAATLAEPMGGIVGAVPQMIQFAPGHAAGTSESKTEQLGTQSVNNVLAEGTRSTMTIPTGEIGNDRPIEVVNERWFSNELGMMVKSRNNDPRFGETTYEMTNISRGEPDPSLFQVPSDYTNTAPVGAIPAIALPRTR